MLDAFKNWDKWVEMHKGIQTQAEPPNLLSFGDIKELIDSMKPKIKYIADICVPEDKIFGASADVFGEPMVIYNPNFWEFKDDKLIRKEVINERV